MHFRLVVNGSEWTYDGALVGVDVKSTIQNKNKLPVTKFRFSSVRRLAFILIYLWHYIE